MVKKVILYVIAFLSQIVLTLALLSINQELFSKVFINAIVMLIFFLIYFLIVTMEVKDEK